MKLEDMSFGDYLKAEYEWKEKKGAGMNEPNYDVIEVLLDLRKEVLEIPTHRDHFYPREIWSYKGDVLEIIDRKIGEQE